MAQEPLRAELIRHLSAEITTQEQYLSTFRSRISFSVLIGPFAVLGSLLFSAKGKLMWPHEVKPWIALTCAMLCYLGLGVYGAILDKQVTNQCNAWRKIVASLVTDDAVGTITLEFQGYHHILAYVTGLALSLGALAGTITFCVALLSFQ